MNKKKSTVKIKELKIEVEKEVHDKGKILEKIKIPKGWRLITINEVVWLANSKYAEELKMNLSTDDYFFFKQPFNCNKNNSVAWFGTDSDRAYLDCYGDPRDSVSSLGVRFCRDLKEKRKNEL